LIFRTVNPQYDVVKNSAEEVWFTTDEDLVYTAFFADFGPLDVGKMYTFCRRLDEHMKSSGGKRVVYYCKDHEHFALNSAVLILAYMIFVRNASLEEAYGPFQMSDPPFTTFRDAAFCLNTCPLTILDCALALRRVADLAHFKLSSFDIKAYDHLSKLQNGDVSWIIPNKFIAFSGPLTKRRNLGDGNFTMIPAEYVPLFKKLNVTCIIRFNNKCYDKTVFTAAGIHHVELFYEDGGNPTQQIMQRFIQICEKEKGAIAVHCKAGLGRTGTNIGAYMMKHYGYSAREATAWCRICRPGSVVGPQQQFLANVEAQMHREGQQYRQQHGLNLFWQGSIGRSVPSRRSGSTAISAGTTDQLGQTFGDMSLTDLRQASGLARPSTSSSALRSSGVLSNRGVRGTGLSGSSGAVSNRVYRSGSLGQDTDSSQNSRDRTRPGTQGSSRAGRRR
jgi:cell division cycle 14